MALLFFRICCGKRCTLFCEVKLPLALFSDRTHFFSRGPFLSFSDWFSFRHCIWLSQPSQPPSIHTLNSTSLPPSLSACSPFSHPSSPPPAQTPSQTQRVDGKYDWILPWLQIMCKTAGKRGTAENRETQKEREKESLSGQLLKPLKQKVFILCSFQAPAYCFLTSIYLFIFFINDLQNKKSDLGITWKSLSTVEIQTKQKCLFMWWCCISTC